VHHHAEQKPIAQSIRSVDILNEISLPLWPMPQGHFSLVIDFIETVRDANAWVHPGIRSIAVRSVRRAS
jgi:hypothetical protein